MDAIGVYRAQIREFFERFSGSRRYKSMLLGVPCPQRIVIDMSDIRQFSKELAHTLREQSMLLIPAFEEVAQEIAQKPVAIGFTGVVGGESTGPRDLLACLLGKLVCVEGIITSSSIVRPKVKKTVHYNKTTNTFVYKEYRDVNALSMLPPTTTVIPKQSMEGNPIELEYGMSEYISHQSAMLQEMPELSPPGQMPRSINLVLENDLAGAIKPGDRVRVYGTYKCVSQIRKAEEVLKTTAILNNIEILKKTNDVTGTDENIRKILSEQGVEGIVSHIAPSIYGHQNTKKAILLMLIGGTPITSATGGHIRGDINILMVGDPGIAKSQLLRYILDISPLAVGTTGRGASGVGLTAAVVSDPDTGSRRIEAGAMVLADTGIVCIDEFDKMDESERAAIHEAMEQQTVTIAKGGIYTSLNARCSVLAAANPVSGQYRPSLSPRDNIKLPESILTRFDLIFIMEDTMEYDAEIAEHVLRRRMGKSNFMPQLTQNDLKLYIQLAKQKQPVFSTEAEEYIEQEYLRLREEGEANRSNLSRGVTARMLETIIRLSTAHAKARLSDEVTLFDSEVAVSMIESTLWRKSIRPRRNAVPIAKDVLEALFQYRENNPNEQIVSIDTIATRCNKDKYLILEDLKTLEKDGLFSIVDNMIIFTYK
ncbi:DNA replication licensing factor MCM3 [Nematocida sp. AWRm80]|nr:DNA replication licensing factor MCM3 [Nematocida sp. AWRm80]